MCFYTGVVPADGHTAQAGVNWSPQPPTTVRATSNPSNYATQVTPAQAYARSVVSGQPVLQYTIEHKQLEKLSGQQPGPNLQSPIDVSTRGQSYAQRLYASSLGKRPQAQTHQQPTSRKPFSEESPGTGVPAGPRAPYDSARASLMLNAGHIVNAPQTVSALDFYNSGVSKLNLQSPVPDRGINVPGARHPQSATGSASSISVVHSSVPIHVSHGLQAPRRRSPVPVELSDGPPSSPAGDPRRSSQGLHCKSSPSITHMIPGSSTSSDIPLRSESVNHDIVSPVPPETLPREFSPYSEDYSRDSACVATVTSNPESVTQPSDPLHAPIQTESFDVGGSEEVPLYSLVDDEPPPPDFDESQFMCSVTRAPIVLAPPNVPSPTPHESDAVSGAVLSPGADAASSIGTARALSLSSHQPYSPPLPPRIRPEPTSPPSSAGTSPSIATSAGTTAQMYYAISPSPLPSPPLSRRSRGPSILSASSAGSRPAKFRPQLSPDVSPTLQGQAPYQSPRQNLQSQASPPPPPQHARAPTSPAQAVQSNRGLETNIATGLLGGVLGLFGGAVLAETLSGGDTVNDIIGSMDGMTFGNSADGQLDPNMGTGNIMGNGFDPTANFQGDQTFTGDSFDPAYYQGDQPVAGDSFDPTYYQGDQPVAGDSFSQTYYQGDQLFVGDSFGQTYDMSNQTTGIGVDPNQFQGQSSMQPGPYFVSEQNQETQQIEFTQTFELSLSQQQPNNQSNQSSGTHYPMSGTSSTSRPSNSPPIGYAQTSYPSPTQQTGQSMHPMASQPAQPPTATPFSQYHPSVNPTSQQGTHPLSHHHAYPQSSHTSHTQSPHMNHVAYPSFGSATHTMYSQGPPIPAQYAVNHGHGTAPHHAYSPQSQAGYSVHPVQYHAQGNSQQSPTGQQPPSAGAGLNKVMLAKQFVKGALIAGGVLARYNHLSRGDWFVDNDNDNGNGNENNGGFL